MSLTYIESLGKIAVGIAAKLSEASEPLVNMVCIQPLNGAILDFMVGETTGYTIGLKGKP